MSRSSVLFSVICVAVSRLVALLFGQRSGRDGMVAFMAGPWGARALGFFGRVGGRSVSVNAGGWSALAEASDRDFVPLIAFPLNAHAGTGFPWRLPNE
ncbi:hypothetical protein FMN50_24650 [Rhodobacterales bacterium]|nr:hypothetical protein FMN50_24650 [Rhodobacterales bacterium]